MIDEQIFEGLLNSTKMNFGDYVNCYCFNPACKKSIYKAAFNKAATTVPLLLALTQENYCSECSQELVSIPLLEVRAMVRGSLDNEQPVELTC